MKIKSQYFLFFILLYPVFYNIPYINNTVGYTFANIYFIFVLVLILPVIFFQAKKPIERKQYINIVLTAIILLIVFFNSDYTSLKPLLFFAYVFFLNIFLSVTKIKISTKLIYLICGIYIISSLGMLANSNRFINEGRFSGFVSSPTVFSTFIEALLIIFLLNTTNKFHKIIIFLIAGFFVFISETRLNIIFLVFIPVAWLFSNNKKLRSTIFFLCFVALNFVYPTYEYLTTNRIINQSMNRGESTSQGNSYKTRIMLYIDIKNEFLNSSYEQIIFGHGSEHVRNMIKKRYENDILPHNDFLRIIVDFGLIFFILFIIFLHRISIDSETGYMISLLYLLSFYHNMVYSFMLISIILCFSFLSKNQVCHDRNS